MIVKTVILAGLMGMHKTGCSGETRHLARTDLAHHEPENMIITDWAA